MRIGPSQVTEFLTTRGWQLSKLNSFPELLTFTHQIFGGRQLFLPVNESASDYKDALQILLTKLAVLERKNVAAITGELECTDVRDTSSITDGLALRILRTVSNDASIPLSLANAVISETEVVLMAGSCTAENPQHYYRRIDNKISNEIYDRSVFNHTQRGSFVMSVSCPIAGVGEQLGFGLDPNEWTKSRRAFVSIYRGMRSLTGAINDDRVEQFSDETLASTSPMVSSNFCEALANIVSKDSGDGIKVGFEWSPYVPLPADISVESPILLTQAMSDGLYLISGALRPKQSPLDDDFIGTVEALRGDVTESGKRAGAVEFSLLLKDGLSIRASAFLTPEQYKLADEAHIGGARYISIAGKLDPHPRVWVFAEIRSFSLIDN